MSITSIFVPDVGAGKRIHHTVFLDVPIQNELFTFELGMRVSFASSGVVGIVVAVADLGGANPEIYVKLDDDTSTVLTSGEAINVGGTKYAEVKLNTTGTPFYNQKNVIAGGNNPINEAFVDDEGAMYTRFAEGSPQLDAFGKMQVSTQHKLAEYIHNYNELPNDYTTEITGGASMTYEPNVRGVLLTCGTAAGDKVVRTTDEYHTHQAGVSQLLEFTACIGDQGKANVVRRAGLYDDQNGLFFQMDGTTFGVGLRSYSTGSVVNTIIPQTQWNGDPMDGTGISGITIDPSKDNIYWLDYQWLGAGSIRFGVIVNGVRIVCHSIHNANTQPWSYMTTASLPFRYMQENTGVAGSSSEFRVFCAVVKTEGTFNPFRRAFSVSNTVNINTTTAKPLISIRPIQTFLGKDNRCTIYPNSFSLYNHSSEPMIFELNRGATPGTGVSWTAYGGESTAELDFSATDFTGGSVRKTVILPPQTGIEVPFKTFEENRRGLRRKANVANYAGHTYSARLIAAGTGGNVTMALNWDEVRD